MKTGSGGSRESSAGQPSRRGRPPTRGTPKEKPMGTEGLSRRKRKRSSSSEEEGTSQERRSKLPKTTPFKTAQLFRKDLISAMKLPDSDHLSPDDYWLIGDPWRQEWEQPVQVPVCPDQLPSSRVSELRPKIDFKFRLPKRYLCLSGEKAQGSKEFVQAAATLVPQLLSAYDLDELDIAWLDIFNLRLEELGYSPLSEENMEKAIYDFELQSNEIYQKRKKLEEGLGLEYDENVVCEICKSPDSYEHNEIVFCDACNISLHQYCYGIPNIPEGTWLCQPCAQGVRPSCVLCPNQGGALKLLKDGTRWIHVSCAIWIPEVDIEKLDRMEPIGGIKDIPEQRWSLLCSLCHTKEGACIQCSVKSCAVAYHVTCGYLHGLHMAYDLRSCLHSEASFFESFCLKHTKERKKENQPTPEDGSTSPKSSSKEECSFADRQQRIKALQQKFYEGVSLEVTRRNTNIQLDHLYFFFNYWVLKRRSNFNQALYSFTTNQRTLNHIQEDSIFQKIKICIRLRQDLERIRNLCYMVSRREKLFKSWIQVNKDIGHQQLDLLASSNLDQLSEEDFNFIVQASNGNSIYDMVYKSADLHFDPIEVPPSEDWLLSSPPIAPEEGKEKKKRGRKRKTPLEPPSIFNELQARDPIIDRGALVNDKPPRLKRAYRRRKKPAFPETLDNKKSLGRKSTRSMFDLANTTASTTLDKDQNKFPKETFNFSNIKKNVPKIFKALQIIKAKRGKKPRSDSPETRDKSPPLTPSSETKAPPSPRSPENPYAKHYLRQSIERANKKFSLDGAEVIKKVGKTTSEDSALPGSESPIKHFRKCKMVNSDTTSTNQLEIPDNENDKCNKPPPPQHNPRNRTVAKTILTNRLNRSPSLPRKVKKQQELKENTCIKQATTDYDKLALDSINRVKLGVLTIPCERLLSIEHCKNLLNGVLKESMENSRFPSRRKNLSCK